MGRGKAVAFVVAMLGLGACSLALGKHYSPYQPVPGGMGVVYIYSADATALQHVYIDRDGVPGRVTHTLSILTEGYIPFLGTGTVRVLSGPSDKAECVEVELTPNSAAWVRVSGSSPYVDARTESEASEEIAKTREMDRSSLDATPAAFPTESCGQ